MSDAGYPSWLPKRPPPPAPQSTFQSSVGPEPPSAADIFGSISGRKATPRSVRIVARDVPWREREPTGDSAETRVQQPLAYQRRSMTLSGPPTRPRPRFRAPSLHLALLRSPATSMRIRYFLHPVFMFAHLVVQTYFDFNIVFMLLQFSSRPGPTNNPRNWTLAAIAYIACWVLQVIGVFIIYELIYSFWRRWRVKRPLVLPIYLSSPAHDLAALASYNHFCFFAYIRRSARPSLHTLIRPHSPAPPTKIPPHLASTPPLSSSPPASSPTPPTASDTTSQATSSTGTPFILSQFSDYIAEKCYWRAQNWPTVALLLPRAALSLAILFQRPVGADTGRDPTYFNAETGALSGYAKGILLTNAAWAVWRCLVMLGGIVGLWILSGTACGGLCGPRYRWEEEPELEEDYSSSSAWDKRASAYSYYSDHLAAYPTQAGYDADDVYVSDAWIWKKGTRARVREAWEFCLTSRSGVVGSLEGKVREHGHVSRPRPPGDDDESPTTPRVYSTRNVRARSKPSTGAGDEEDEDHDEFAALEEVIRKSVLARGERYRRMGAGAGAGASASEARAEGLSDIIPPMMAASGSQVRDLPEVIGSQRSGKGEPLRVLPFPFPSGSGSRSGSGSAEMGSPQGMVPFPGDEQAGQNDEVGEGEEEEDGEEEEEEEEEEGEEGDQEEEGSEEYDEEEEEDPISPATRRTSESMSSLGQPLSPYPFVGIGNTASPVSTPPQMHSRTSSSITGTQRTRSSGTGSGSGSRSARRSVGGASNFSSPGLTRSSRGQTHSTPSTNPPVSSPAQTYSSPSTNPASTPGHVPSSSSASSPHTRSPIPASFIPPPPGTSERRRRRRAGTGPGLVSGQTGSADLGVVLPVRGRTRTMSSAGRSEDPEPIAVYEEEEEGQEDGDGASEGNEARSEEEEEGLRLTPEDAEQEDSVGLLSASASARGSVSPRPSLLGLGGLRGRKSSGALSMGSRSRKESTGSTQGVLRSRTLSGVGGGASIPPRSRTQSLIQRVTELGGMASGGTRSRSVSQSGSASASGSGESRRTSAGGVGGVASGSNGSRRESSGVESSASNSAEAGEGAMHAPGVENTFGRPGELRRQVEEARIRLGLSVQPSSSSLAPPPSTSHTHATSTGTSTPSLRTAHSELTARGVDVEDSDMRTQTSDADLSTAHESFVTAPMTMESGTSSGTEEARGGLGMPSAWTLRQGQDQWGHGVHGPM